MNRNLLVQWFCSKDLGERRVIRSENVGDRIEVKGQVLIVPKSEICAHFDGYSHIRGYLPRDPDEIFPPLFIPFGFFERNIRVAYGYPDYRKDWVNINPMKENYSFTDPIGGTDLKIGIDGLPLFWKDRIAQIDINPRIEKSDMEKAIFKERARIASPWPRGSLANYYGFRAGYYLRLAGKYADNPDALKRVIDNSPVGVKKGIKSILHRLILLLHRLGIMKKKAS